MAKEKNFTLRIDARLLDAFQTVCRKQDQVASAVVRESMRAHIRQWRKRCSGMSAYVDDTVVADDDLVPGFVPGSGTDKARLLAQGFGRAHRRQTGTPTEAAEAAEAKLKRKLDAERQAKIKADAAQSLAELKKKIPSPTAT
jgi:hypothetical protein